METINENINIALSVIQEFGSHRAIPVKERIANTIPNISEDEIRLLIETCKNIESTAYDMATLVINKKMTQDEFMDNLKNKYPLLNSERVSTTLNQAMYFALK